MVRILSCHHFRGQRIGRCDEAVGVTAAGDAIIVALEHQVNVYGRIDPEAHWSSEASSPAHPGPGYGATGIPGFGINDGQATHDIGTAFTYHRTALLGSPKTPNVVGPKTTGRPRTTSGSSSVDSVDSDTELRLSNSFSTVDPIDQISYNEKGKYILCLERRETSSNLITTSVRVYFHWEKNHESKPMRARIAGLVSPTGAEPEDDSLMMVEIPLTSPATAVTSCNLSGHIACLSAESIINLFLFRAKEATGRMKVHYCDFDRVYAIEMPGFVPEKIYFLADYIACMNSQKVHVFRMKKEDKLDDHGHTVFEKTGRATAPTLPAFFTDYKSNYSPKTSNKQTDRNSTDFDKVVFDPKNETVKVHLNCILRSNRKRRSPSALICEEFSGEIASHFTKVIFTAIHPGISVEDVLRVSINNQGTGGQSSTNNQRFIQLGMYPIRIKDNLGAVAFVVASTKEGCLYHLPCKRESLVTRVTNYPLTAPLVSFTFDSLFFHALTETGLESYTCRSLYQTVRDIEGLKTFKNDCPFHDEAPSLVGIRPFLRVRHMACNDRSLCILACSTTNPHQGTTGRPSGNGSLNEENLWTIYTLELPDIDMIYEDIMRTAQSQVETNRESYFTLLCEAHTLLRLYMNAHPDTEFAFVHRYRETCKLIGFEYLKSSWINPLSSIASAGSGSLSAADAPVTPSSNLPSISSSPPSEFSYSVSAYSSLNISEDLVDKGVTYLIMGRCDLQEVFSPENSAWLREPRYIPGFVRLIEVTFSELQSHDGNMENHRISPTLAPILVEFLANNGPHILVDLVIRVPFLRECNSRRLIHILQQLAESREYHSKETLALLLTLVTVGSVEQPTRNQVKEILHKTKISDLMNIIHREAILDKRGKQTYLSDLAVCFAASDSPQLVINTVVSSLKRNQILIWEVMLAFSQAVNLNANTVLQHCITKCLTSILETYLSEKLAAIMSEEREHDSNRTVFPSPTYQEAGVASGKHPKFTDEEKRAVQTLVRTYLSSFNVGFTQNTQVSPVNHHPKNINIAEQITNEHHAHTTATTHTTHTNSSNKIASHSQNQLSQSESHNARISTPGEGVHRVSSQNTPSPTDTLQKNQIFGKIPSFVNFLLSLNTPGGTLAPQSQSLASTSVFPNEESRESFIKLLSLLTSILANTEEVKDLVLTYLYKNTSQMKPSLNSPLHVILQVLAEPTEKSILILLLKQPTTVMLYAKEMYGRVPSKWKVLVANLKKKLQTIPDSAESDVFATILESVYLHLANTLTPAELEQVLDKETEESSKFHGICKRVELANTYANMIITVSSDYLGQK